MKVLRALINPVVAAFLAATLGATLPANADQARLDQLFKALQTTDDAGARAITQEIWVEWSKSGSPAMDLLLRRGEQAMAAGDLRRRDRPFHRDHRPRPEISPRRGTSAPPPISRPARSAPRSMTSSTCWRLNPRHFGALAGLGMIFEELGEPGKALEVYKAALAINPHMTDVKDAVKRLSAAKGQDL